MTESSALLNTLLEYKSDDDDESYKVTTRHDSQRNDDEILGRTAGDLIQNRAMIWLSGIPETSSEQSDSGIPETSSEQSDFGIDLDVRDDVGPNDGLIIEERLVIEEFDDYHEYANLFENGNRDKITMPLLENYT